jgi:methionyl aminopeptidase
MDAKAEYALICPTLTISFSILKEPVSHYMLNKNYSTKYLDNSNEKKLFELIKKNYSTLPFCQKWLYQLDNNINHNISLDRLVNKKILNSYPPIYDIENSIVSQFEHTIFVKNNGIINLTKNQNY